MSEGAKPKNTCPLCVYWTAALAKARTDAGGASPRAFALDQGHGLMVAGYWLATASQAAKLEVCDEHKRHIEVLEAMNVIAPEIEKENPS